MKERDALKEEATRLGDEELMKEYKKVRNQVRHRLPKDKPKYYKDRFHDKNMSVKMAWKYAYDLLGKVDNKSPVKINYENKIVANPKALANAFNKIFRDKVDKLREKTMAEPKVDPVIRLNSWLAQRNDPIPEFQLRPINIHQLRKIMKKLKPSRSHGLNFIDSFSLKLAFPLIEDSILHLVNLSITKKEYSKN